MNVWWWAFAIVQWMEILLAVWQVRVYPCRVKGNLRRRMGLASLAVAQHQTCLLSVLYMQNRLTTVLILPTGLAHHVLYGSCWFARCCLARSVCIVGLNSSNDVAVTDGDGFSLWRERFAGRHCTVALTWLLIK